MPVYQLSINGTVHRVEGEPDTPLIWILRNQHHLASVRYGCGTEACGACRVLVDGQPTYSCTAGIAECDGKAVTTVEGLAVDGKLHPLQQAILEFNAGQCGYCLSGILMTAYQLIENNPAPSRAEIQEALDAHLCRCGSHNRIIRAIQKAAADV